MPAQTTRSLIHSGELFKFCVRAKRQNFNQLLQNSCHMKTNKYLKLEGMQPIDTARLAVLFRVPIRNSRMKTLKLGCGTMTEGEIPPINVLRSSKTKNERLVEIITVLSKSKTLKPTWCYEYRTDDPKPFRLRPAKAAGYVDWAGDE